LNNAANLLKFIFPLDLLKACIFLSIFEKLPLLRDFFYRIQTKLTKKTIPEFCYSLQFKQKQHDEKAII
jgi:hypothetical protein